jgi:phenylalanyl-tRNA synthetase beta chain
MQRRLMLAGMRPINNVVDITNYVMLELGQPLHAFDLDLLRPKAPGEPPAIIVRRAHPGERMTTLDGVERTFDGEMLLITDGGGPVAIAGVMGGLESEVSPQTRNILLEAANFDYLSVRRTSQLLKLSSEAATRFGRGLDPELTLVALRRAAELMRELAGGTVAAGLADLYPRPPAPKVIDFRVPEVKRILGIELSARNRWPICWVRWGSRARSCRAIRPSCEPQCPDSGWMSRFPPTCWKRSPASMATIGCRPLSWPMNCRPRSATCRWSWKSGRATSW